MAGSHKLLIDKWMDGWTNLEPMDQQMGMVHSWCAHLLTVTSHHCIVTATLCQVAADLAMARSHPLKPCILPAHNVGIRPEKPGYVREIQRNHGCLQGQRHKEYTEEVVGCAVS